MLYTLAMASLQKYSVKGKQYFRIVESRRIDGKPRAIPILHLGTADALLKRLTEKGQEQELSVKSFEHGAIACLLKIAEELDLEAIIDRHVGKTIRGVSTGRAILLMALNRLIDPCSKNAWANWAKKTSLFRFFPNIPLSKISSQFLWEHMQLISEDSILKIEEELVATVVKKYGLKLDLLFYDTTNCYSYAESRDDPDWLFAYGHSKERQDHRRLFGVELLVTRESVIPLYHNTYKGNRNDSKLFPEAVYKLCNRLERIGLSLSDLTLIFDRGNFSKANFKLLDQSKLGFVSALRLGDIPRELFNIPLQKFRKIKVGDNQGLPFYIEKLELWGKQRLVVFYISDRVRSYQTKLLNDQIDRSLRELADWNATILNQTTDNSIDPVKVKKKIESLLTTPYLKEILKITFDPNLPKQDRLQFSVDHKAKEDVILKYFGKRALVTNRIDWHPSAVIDAYFSQVNVENAFRTTKDRHHISIRPQFHWTNQSLRVHVFSCFIALLLGQLLLRKARNQDPKIGSLPVLLDALNSIRIAAFLKKGQSSLKNPSLQWKVERAPSKIIALFHSLST